MHRPYAWTLLSNPACSACVGQCPGWARNWAKCLPTGVLQEVVYRLAWLAGMAGHFLRSIFIRSTYIGRAVGLWRGSKYLLQGPPILAERMSSNCRPTNAP
eukprot:scaffold65311_cov17-Tisochrysis_lutea.AAC.1